MSILKTYIQNDILNESFNISNLGNGSLQFTQKSIYNKMPAFSVVKSDSLVDGVTLFRAYKIFSIGDFAKENNIEKTIVLNHNYITISDNNILFSSQLIEECLDSGFYYFKFTETKTSIFGVGNTYYTEPFQLILPSCELLETFTNANTYISFFEIISGGLTFHAFVVNESSFVQLQAKYTSNNFIDVGSVQMCHSATNENSFNVLFDTSNLNAIRIKVWVNEVCQVFYSEEKTFVPLIQNIFNSLGIYGNTVLNNTVWNFPAKIYGGYGLKSLSFASINLLSETIIDVNTSSITWTGTAVLTFVYNNILNFSAGTLQNLKFSDMSGNLYEFPCCESDGYIIHNVRTTCNAIFFNFFFNANDEYFYLLHHNFEVLTNSLYTRKIYIPKKINGTSNFLS